VENSERLCDRQRVAGRFELKKWKAVSELVQTLMLVISFDN